MPLSRSRDYLSIGEVLENVREEFPDVSISKIRFLEAEGLITPERTPSGYRKFYDGDVKRLRYILSLQRDQFLPLKVIRERLAEVDSNGGGYPAGETPRPSRTKDSAPESAAVESDSTGVHMSRDELRTAAELSDAELRGLEEFGLLDGQETGSFDEYDLLVARAAKKFFGYGAEPRHLRMYKQFAEREAAFFEQIVTPVARKRDPEGRREATRSMQELVSLSRQLREGVIRSSLRSIL
jgi:DNA-binding transcriptional MerR regulator